MSWSKLAPISKSAGRPMASASVIMNKDQVAKVSVILSASLFDAFGKRSAAEVSLGADDNAGLILVEFLAEGATSETAFAVKNFVHGGGRLFLPPAEGLPTKAAPSFPCAVVKQEADSVVLRLPLEQWAREIAGRAPASAKSALPPPPPSRPTVVPADDGKLDAVEYLVGKGVDARRLAGGRFQLNGTLCLAGAILRAVNQHRLEAQLPALTAEQVR